MLPKFPTMKKSQHLNLQELVNSCSDDSLSDNDFSPSYLIKTSSTAEFVDDISDTKSFAVPLEKQVTLFRVQDFGNTKVMTLPLLEADDYDLQTLNTPLLPQNEKPLQPVDCVFMMVSSPAHFPKNDSDYLKDRPVLYMWRNLHNIMITEFSQFITMYIKENYTIIRPRLRFYSQIDPTAERLNNLNSIRRDIQGGRILFHYIGYGFPTIDENYMHVLDGKTGKYINYPLRTFFENLKTPAWFVFDCSNAAASLLALKKTAKARQKDDVSRSTSDPFIPHSIDWTDWFCICATDIGETLPSDHHLPRDFLTSCLLKPVTTAIVCHMIQYYRTTIVDNYFPIEHLKSPLLSEDSPTHSSLQQTLAAITDAIAADSLQSDLYRLLFRKDRVTMVIFQRFLLAQYLLRPYQVHPVSHPALPNLSTHPLWQHWRNILDMTISTPNSNFSTDIFVHACKSVRGLLERKEEHLITPDLLMLLFHVPETAPYREESFLLLAQYSATSTMARDVLSRTALFNSVFAALVSDRYNNEVFHALCYLTISLLQTSPRFVNDIRREFDVSSFPDRLFDEKLPMRTRTIVAAIIATVLPHSEGIRSIAVSPPFLQKMNTLLATSDASLSLWSLIIQRRMFDSFGSELRVFFSIGMHIQVASFALHRCPEVRAAALATIPCFLQQNADFSNGQLFGLVMLCAFDGSFLVRYNFILFLSRFLTVYQEKIIGRLPIGEMSHQCFRTLTAVWTGEENPFEQLISNFSVLSSVVDSLGRAPDYLQRFVRISLLLVDYLIDDPHQSVRESAVELRNFVHRLSGYKQKLIASANLSVPERYDHSIAAPSCSFPTRNSVTKAYQEDMEPSDERPAMCESGGDALYKVCVKQLVSAGCDAIFEKQDNETVLTAFPQATMNQIPSTKLSFVNKFKSTGGTPVLLSYQHDKLGLAVATDSGNVLFEDEKGVQMSHNFGECITSLDVVNWEDNPLTVIGTEYGCVYVWEPGIENPRICFRADSPARCGPMPQVVAVQQKGSILTARGNCGTVRLWDMEAQRIASEYYAGANQAVTALTVHPTDPNICVAGFLNGLIVMMDLRCDFRTGPANVDAPKANEKILKISGNVGNSVSFVAATSKGSIMQWESLNNLSILREGPPIVDFDVHPCSPLLVLSPPNSCPVMTGFDMKVVHSPKLSEYGSICAFHPVLTYVAFATKSGEVLQYRIQDSI